MKLINNLQDYLNYFGAATPLRAGRGLYKSTACGPWTSFIVQEAPAHVRSATFAVGRGEDGKLRVVYREEGIDDRDDVTPEDLSRFCFDARGFVEPGSSKTHGSLKKFRKAVEDFADKTRQDKDWTFQVLSGHPHNGEPDPRRVWIVCTETVQAKTRQVYYEDDEANAPLENCTGVKIGSIVEGSDVEIYPENLMFPFTAETLNKCIQGIDDQADFYWKRDNLRSFHVEFKGADYYVEDDGTGIDLLPKHLQSKVTEFIADCELEENEKCPLPKSSAIITRMGKSDFIY